MAAKPQDQAPELERQLLQRASFALSQVPPRKLLGALERLDGAFRLVVDGDRGWITVDVAHGQITGAHAAADEVETEVEGLAAVRRMLETCSGVAFVQHQRFSQLANLFVPISQTLEGVSEPPARGRARRRRPAGLAANPELILRRHRGDPGATPEGPRDPDGGSTPLEAAADGDEAQCGSARAEGRACPDGEPVCGGPATVPLGAQGGRPGPKFLGAARVLGAGLVAALVVGLGVWTLGLGDSSQSQGEDRGPRHTAASSGALADVYPLGREPAPSSGPSARASVTELARKAERSTAREEPSSAEHAAEPAAAKVEQTEKTTDAARDSTSSRSGRSRKEVRKAPSMDPREKARRLRARKLASRTRQALERGRAERALKLADVLVELMPGIPRYHVLQGDARLQAGHPVASLRSFRRALKLDPGYEHARERLMTLKRKRARMERQRQATGERVRSG